MKLERRTKRFRNISQPEQWNSEQVPSSSLDFEEAATIFFRAGINNKEKIINKSSTTGYHHRLDKTKKKFIISIVETLKKVNVCNTLYKMKKQ